MIKNENAWSQLKQEPHASDYSLGGLYFTHTQLSLLGIAHGRLVAVRTRQGRQHPPAEPPVIPVPDVLAAGHGVRPGADLDERVEGEPLGAVALGGHPPVGSVGAVVVDGAVARVGGVDVQALVVADAALCGREKLWLHGCVVENVCVAYGGGRGGCGCG